MHILKYTFMLDNLYVSSIGTLHLLSMVNSVNFYFGDAFYISVLFIDDTFISFVVVHVTGEVHF